MSLVKPLLVTLLLVIQTLAPALPLNVYNVQDGSLSPLSTTSPQDPRPGLSVTGFWSWQDYPYSVPPVEPVVVELVRNYTVSWFTAPDSFVIPVNWSELGYSFSRILLRADVYLVSVAPPGPAVQFDRPFWVYINGIPALFGSTVQRFNQTVIVDVTHLYNVIVGKPFINVTVALRNWALPALGLTGAFSVYLKLLLYPGPKPEGLPDDVIPLFAYSSRTAWPGVSNAWLDRANPVAWEIVRVPEGVSRALLILYTEGFSSEEFWYYDIPPDRFIWIYSDGIPVVVAQPHPWIHTGGLSPLLWRPVPNVKTLGFEPLVIDVTGLLPLLVGERNVTITVSKLKDYWTLAGALAVYREPRALSYNMLSYKVAEPYVLEEERVVGVLPEGVNVYNYTIESTRGLSAVSIIATTAGSLIASTYMNVGIKATQIYDDAGVWSNLTFKLKWDYKTTIAPEAKVGVFKPYRLTMEWVRDVRYGFLVFPEGDVSKATVENPVPANFSLRVTLEEERLRIAGDYMLTNLERVYEGSVKASSELAGRLNFISPTGAIITAVTKTFGENIREEKAKEYKYSQLLRAKLLLSDFYRKVHGYNEWPMWTYKAIELSVKLNPNNIVAP